MAKKQKKKKHQGKKSKKGRKRPSLSNVQREAERCVLESLKETPGYKSLERRSVPIGDDGAHLTPGGLTQANRRMIGVYARTGSLHGAHGREVAAEILKFATIRQQPGFENTRGELYFIDQEALASVRDWQREAANRFGIELKLAEEFPGSLRENLLLAQEAQADDSKAKVKKGKKKKKKK
ncbi:MAG TPA: hypothetical protein VMF31_08170 [Solirubrobacterales bacterium]|nr:hypothetical protein [Solirubrobacterales bacterium]